MAIPLHIHVDVLQVDSAAYPPAIPLRIQVEGPGRTQVDSPDCIQVVVHIQGMSALVAAGALVGRYLVAMEVE